MEIPEPRRVLVILQQALLSCYAETGEEFLVPLPDRFTEMHVLPSGLILAGGHLSAPLLLRHPLQEAAALEAFLLPEGPSTSRAAAPGAGTHATPQQALQGARAADLDVEQVVW